MEVNGIAHIFLTASNFERSREFYRRLLPFLGLKPVIDTDTTYYCVGGRTAVGINAPAVARARGRGVRAKSRRPAPSVFSRPRARRHRRVARFPVFAWCEDHSRAARGSMGAGILLAAVRRSRRNKAGAQSCSGKGIAGYGGGVRSTSG